MNLPPSKEVSGFKLDDTDTQGVQSPFNAAQEHLKTLCSLQRRISDVRIYNATNVDLWRSIADSIYSTLRGGWELSAKELEIYDYYNGKFNELQLIHPKKECKRYLGEKKWEESCNHNNLWQQVCNDYEIALMDVCRRLEVFMPREKSPAPAIKD